MIPSTHRFAFIIFLIAIFYDFGAATAKTTEIESQNKTKLYILWMFGFDGSPHGWGRVPLGRLAFQDINQHPNNLLNDYELVALERPTTRARADLDVKTTLGIFIQAVYNPPQIVMAICPPYTPEATAVAQLAPNYNLITMAGLSTSPALSDKKSYPLFMRTSMSAGDFKFALYNILNRFGWRKIIGLYLDDPFAFDTAAVMERHLETHDVWFETKTVFKTDALDTPVARLVQKCTSRVILAIANDNMARYAICQLFRELGATGAEYIWMFIGISVSEFQRPRPQDTQHCTLREMQQAINGSFWFDYGGLDVEDRLMLTLYRPSELQQRVKVYIDANYASAPDKTVLDLAYREYDAFLALAAALNSSIEVLKTQLNVTLEQFNYSRKDMTAVFKQQLLLMKIQGAAGPIRFQANGDRPASVTLRQFQATNNSLRADNVTGWVTVATQVDNGTDSASGDPPPLVFTNDPILFGTSDGQAPLGALSVGFFARVVNVTLLIVGLGVVCLVLPGVVGMIYWTRRHALAAVARDRKWILNPNDFTSYFLTTNKSALSVLSEASQRFTNNARRRRRSIVSNGKNAISTFMTADGGPPTSLADNEGYFVARYKLTQVVSLFPLSYSKKKADPPVIKDDRKPGSSLAIPDAVRARAGSNSSQENRRLRTNVQFSLQARMIGDCVHDNLAHFVGVCFVHHPSPHQQFHYGLPGSPQPHARNSGIWLEQQLMAAARPSAGLSTDFAVYEWTNNGTLRDVLGIEELVFDTPFKFSMWKDVATGLAYVQRVARFHGRLRSTNVFVDNRFCCKISDYGYNNVKVWYLMQAEKSFLLWTAPELLKFILHQDAAVEENVELTIFSNPGVMQKADIFSLAVITYEILTRRSPYETAAIAAISPYAKADNKEAAAVLNAYAYVPMMEDEILDAIVTASADGDNILYKSFEDDEQRSMSKKQGELPIEARSLFERCCNLNANDRPSAQEVVDTLRRIAKQQGMSNNIMENLLRRVEQYAKNLEALVHEKTQAFFEEKKRAETLLYNILPRSVADQLKDGKAVEPEFYDSVSIYFSDVVGFTNLSAESTPIQVVDLLNDLYNMFDAIIADYDVYKVETIGDAYMVASGLPQRNGIEHGRQISRMAQQLVRDMAQQFRVRHKPEQRLNLRVGLHSGPCAAGVVGFVMPRYCLFGDTVNTASRMESTGEAMRIHVSTSMYELLESFGAGEFKCELRGETAVKGKGVMRTYWLQLPSSPLSTEEAA